MDPSDAALLAEAMGPDADLVAQRLARGITCFVAWIDTTIAGYGWLSTGPEWIGELQLEIKPRPGEGYIWNCVTLPAYRRKGVFGSLLVGIAQAARSRGLKRLWIGTIALPAERALKPAGFRPALRFGYLRIVGLHSMQITRAGDPVLVADASSVLGVGPGFLPLRRLRPRRH